MSKLLNCTNCWKGVAYSGERCSSCNKMLLNYKAQKKADKLIKQQKRDERDIESCILASISRDSIVNTNPIGPTKWRKLATGKWFDLQTEEIK